MNKKTLYGTDARKKIREGVEKIVNAIKVTLGSNGRNVVISNSAIVDMNIVPMPLIVTKDGVTVARNFDTTDQQERVGVMLIKEACEKTVSMAGDGTTTTAVLAGALVEQGMKVIEEGANSMELKRQIDNAVELVINHLKDRSIPLKGDLDKIRQIATVSANNDAAIGDMIAAAFSQIGEDGIIDLEPSKSVKTEIKVSNGFKLNSGWISPLFINNIQKQICEFDDPIILMYDKKVTHHTQVERALTISMQSNKPLVIVCEDAEQEGLAFLQLNNYQGRVKCCVIKSPDFGEARREYMEDLAVITGGVYISDLKGVGVKEVEMQHFGRAKKVVISKEETIIIEGYRKEDEWEKLKTELLAKIESAKDEDEKFVYEKRMARISGAVATIQVGAQTETEMKEKLDRFDDAVRATKAAIAEGYVPGGGSLFIRLSDLFLGAGNTLGEKVVLNSIKEPFYQICRNAGIEPEKIELDILRQVDNYGYNAKSEKIENLIESGIIDPTKVLRCSLQNAASVAGLILTSECMIVDMN